MFVAEVELPDDLGDALVAGRLVLFAGAGVSMGSPSRLPDFRKLAKQVAGDAVGPPKKREHLDQYLGRAESQGVPVQDRTRQLLDVASSRPTALHRDIVRLFGAPERVRIVTTNFDRHFKTAITDRHGEGSVPVYMAPALPLGRDARGLIHLHGALEVLHHPLVLTDGDFGRAYLTEGWATRFLVELFGPHNAVCFVGYSHDEPPMRYLARSLPPGTKRFALAPVGDERRWQELGIQAVPYPRRSPRAKHGALDTAIAAWAHLAGMGALEHERRIREVVDGAPPIEPSERDYLRMALAAPGLRPFFVRHARGVEWLQFTEETGALDPLFGDGTRGAPGEGSDLADWLAEHFMLQHPGELLELLRARERRPSHTLWNSMAWRLVRANPGAAPDLLTRWIAFLVSARELGWPARPLSRLLERCPPVALTGALLLLGHLVIPSPRLTSGWGSSEKPGDTPRLRFEITLPGDDRLLRQSWVDTFRPALPVCHHRIGAIVTECLGHSHGLLSAAGVADADMDPLSFRRSAIEPHTQDLRTQGIDFVVDIARDLLEFLATHAPSVADAWITIWREAQAPLLRRLAIHGLAERAHARPAEALDQVLAAGWMTTWTLQHETYRLIARAYAAAEEVMRRRFLDAALEQLGSGEPSEVAYAQFNLLVWLQRAAPGSATTAERLAVAKAANPEFEPREHPDLTAWTSEARFVVPVPPLSVAELLASSPAAELEWLLTYQGDERTGEGPDREGLLRAVRDACRASFDWSWLLADALRDRGEADDHGLWEAVLGAWQDSALEATHWERVLGLVDSLRHLERTAPQAVSHLLEHAAKESGGVPSALLGIVRDVAERLAERDDLPDTVRSSEGPDWLLLAINHPAGRAAIAWLRTVGTLRREAGEGWIGIPMPERARLERVLVGETVGADRARTVFASQARFLYALDSDWATHHLFSLFDWQVDPDRAAHAWDGFLFWGSWDEALFEHLLPSLEQTFERIGSMLEHRREHLAKRLVGAALYSSADPWHGGWLRSFISKADAETHLAWAEGLGQELRKLSDEARTLVWERWIADYWCDRLDGVTRPLTERERQAMVEWIFGLQPDLPDVVELIERAPVPLGEHSMLLHELREARLAETYPQPIARLLRHLLTCTPPSPQVCLDAEALTSVLIDGSADRSVLLEICQSLAGHYCPGAGALHERLGSSAE